MALVETLLLKCAALRNPSIPPILNMAINGMGPVLDISINEIYE
jgi:hypothetical protein